MNKLTIAIQMLFLFLTMSCSKIAERDILSGIEKDNRISFNDVRIYLSITRNITKSKEEYDIYPIIFHDDTVFFAVEYKDGWELLSADKRMPRSLIYQESGKFNFENLLQNPVESLFVQRIIDKTLFLHENQNFIIEQEDSGWTDLLNLTENPSWVLIGQTILIDTTLVQDHLTVTRWGQGDSYNGRGKWNSRAPFKDSTRTSRCIMGCVPVAAGQMLYFLHYKFGLPSKAYMDCSTNRYIENDYLQLPYSDIIFAPGTYSRASWDRMPLSYNDSIRTDFHPVSTLLLQLGSRLGAEYHENSTSASTYKIKDVFEGHFQIHSLLGPYDSDDVCNEILERNIPVVISISRVDSVRHGHSIIADGFRSRHQKILNRYVWNSLSGPVYRNEISDLYDEYVAINWGWEGAYMNESSSQSTRWYGASEILWSSEFNYTSRDTLIYNFRR